jgi:hypothetical protein
MRNGGFGAAIFALPNMTSFARVKPRTSWFARKSLSRLALLGATALLLGACADASTQPANAQKKKRPAAWGPHQTGTNL